MQFLRHFILPQPSATTTTTFLIPNPKTPKNDLGLTILHLLDRLFKPRNLIYDPEKGFEK